MTYKQIRKNFIYKDGFLYWNISRKGVQFGKQVGRIMPNGYMSAMLDYKAIGVHRLIFLYHNEDFNIGYKPRENQIDHINGIRDDNRIENLRVVTCQENHMNRTTAKGYGFEKSRNKWRASITTKGVSRIIGRYDTELEARDAYLEAKQIEHNIEE